MPKKKLTLANPSLTIHDYANSPKPTSRLKKTTIHNVVAKELTWEDITDFDHLHITNADSTKDVKNNKHSESQEILNRPGIVYPEIVWYLISRYVSPEDIGRFAGINKTTNSITKQESFWRRLYKDYCAKSQTLPDELRTENVYSYGLRSRVIRGLFHTYNKFTLKTNQSNSCNPHKLLNWRCVSVWYCKGTSNWVVYFKFKNMQAKDVNRRQLDMIEELGRIDANQDDRTKVFQVTCKNGYYIPPLMGFTLISVNITLGQDLRTNRITMGFHSGHYALSKISPEHSLIFDSVVSMHIFDWWHPKYPYQVKRPPVMTDEESKSMLEEDFFSLPYTDL